MNIPFLIIIASSLFLFLIAIIVFLCKSIKVLYISNKNCKENERKNKENTCPDDMCSLTNSMDPKYCPSSAIIQKTCQDEVSNDDCKTDSSKQCALELLIGENIHFTVAYICQCPKDENQFLNDLINYIKNNWKKSTTVDIILGNMMSGWFENNSRCIIGDLAELKTFVMNYLNGKYCMTNGIWGSTPHTQVLFDDGCYHPYKTVDILDIKNWKIDY